ncbi:MAG: hypothetical protein M9949_06680 [Candidatus Kapabacteria bacterium]|nr:hypothetical protein [Candidatus Kapabacteria bacterium]
MRLILYCCIFVTLSLAALSQDLLQYEYYFNTDPGVGNGTVRNITGDDSVLVIDSVDLTNLEVGFHRLCFRFKDEDGTWSNSVCRIFNVKSLFVPESPLLTDAEYYINEDPGIRNAIAFDIGSAEQILLIDSVPFADMDYSFHRLCFRFKNEDGAWSNSVCRLFYVNQLSGLVSPMLTDAEYYFNNDPGIGNATAFGFDEEFDIVIIDSIDLSSLEQGFHSFCFRFKNANDVWTSTTCRNFLIDEFIVEEADVVAGEFWLGSDPGMGNAEPIRFVEPGVQAIMFDQAMLDGLEAGVHTIYARTRNSQGVWGAIFSQEFTIDAQGVPVLVYPADMATDVEIIPTTDWNAVPTATSYTVEISTDFVEFEDNIVFSESVAFLTELIISEGVLDTNKTYYWRVNATVGGNATDWSAYYTFKTKDDLVKFVIQLSQGWNMISSNVESDVSSLPSITSAISDKLVIMKDNVGNIYFPQFEIDLIENWDVTQGYQIFMNEAANLNIWGNVINPTQEVISLNAGWNMVSYLRYSNMAPPTALNSMVQAGVLVIVKDNLGNIYYPDFEIDTIELMKPGQGYQMFLLNSFDLTYPAN